MPLWRRLLRTHNNPLHVPKSQSAVKAFRGGVTVESFNFNADNAVIEQCGGYGKSVEGTVVPEEDEITHANSLDHPLDDILNSVENMGWEEVLNGSTHHILQRNAIFLTSEKGHSSENVCICCNNLTFWVGKEDDIFAVALYAAEEIEINLVALVQLGFFNQRFAKGERRRCFLRGS